MTCAQVHIVCALIRLFTERHCVLTSLLVSTNTTSQSRNLWLVIISRRDECVYILLNFSVKLPELSCKVPENKQFKAIHVSCVLLTKQ